MMGHLYADEDFPLGAVQILRSWGHDVLTIQEAGRCGKPDPEVLADATADGRAVLTHNHRDFQRLHAVGHPHGGMISCSRDDNNLPALAVMPSLANQLIRIIRPNPPLQP